MILLKGVDRQMVRIDNEVKDEIQAYQNMRYNGSQEACGRLLSIPQSERYPSNTSSAFAQRTVNRVC